MINAEWEKLANESIEDAAYWKKAAKQASGRCLILSKQRDELLEALEDSNDYLTDIHDRGDVDMSDVINANQVLISKIKGKQS